MVTARCLTRLFWSFTLLVSFAGAPPPHARASDGIDSLINSLDRPTISEIRAVVPRKARGMDLISERDQADANRVIQVVKEHGPQIIALFERAYPGATWAPLGRDAVQMGDFLDAFYHSIGQSGRVARLNSSGGGVRGQDQEGLLRFLFSSGMPVDPLSSPPYVILDRTSYNNGGGKAQTFQLLEAAYEHFRERGHRPSRLVRQINVITLNWSINLQMSQQDEYFSRVQSELASGESSPIEVDLLRPVDMSVFASIWKQLRERVRGFRDRRKVQVQLARDPYYFMPSSILGYSNGWIDETLIDTPAWHDTFSQLTDYKGKFQGMPTGGVWEDSHRYTLGVLIEIMRTVSTPAFRRQVEAEAARLGYVFPMSRATELEPVSDAVIAKHLQDELATLVKSLRRKRGEQTRYYSENGQRMSDWLRARPTSSDARAEFELFVRAVFRAHETDKIGTRDLRRLIAQLIVRTPMSTDAETAVVLEAVSSIPELRELLAEKAWAFVSEATRDHADLAEKFGKIRELYLQPMGCAMVLTKPEPLAAALGVD